MTATQVCKLQKPLLAEGYCQCGCGKKTKLSSWWSDGYKKDERLRFVKGHRGPSWDKRFWNKVRKTDSCWLWTARLDKDGYGKFQIFGRTLAAHRVSWMLMNGAIPEGMTLDHVRLHCVNKNCVNPTHLEIVSFGENVLRGNNPPAVNARKSHCIYGHPLSGENLHRRDGKRICKTCNRLRWHKKQEAPALETWNHPSECEP